MESDKSFRSLLVAVDGSREAHLAASKAVDLARDLGAKLYVLYVVNTHDIQSLGIYMSEALHELRQEGQAILNEALTLAREARVEAEGLLLEGRPGDTICRVAQERQVDIVVVGATGKSGLAEILLGSISQYVLRHCRLPVLVVRDRTDQAKR